MNDSREDEPSRPVTREDSQPDVPTPVVDVKRDRAAIRKRGETVGRYVVVDTLGRGGMGVVYAAWDPKLDRRIALKLVSVDGNGDTQHARLLREAQALARLVHPNVVEVHDVGLCEGQVFIAMEHVNGQSLRKWLERERRSLREVLEVFVAAGRGLAAAHEANLVHRDFKPDNVLVGEAGEVKVLDFGLARDERDDDRPRAREWAESEPAVARALERAASESNAQIASAKRESGSAPRLVGSALVPAAEGSVVRPASITVTGTVLGTPAYMAPEQHEHATVDARSDQYAFCVSLWEALYGKRPFSGRRSELLARRKRKLQIRESSRGLRVPRWLRSLMLRGLSPRRRRRFASMNELLAELEANLVERRRWLVPVAVLITVAVLAASLSLSMLPRVDALPCTAPVERLEGVWDDARRASVEASMLASDLSYAEDSWTRVASRLDDYRERWLAAEVEVCVTRRARGQHGFEPLERRIACLERGRRELAGLSSQLTQGDAETIEYATRAASSLTPIGACGPERGSEPTPLPPDAPSRIQVAVQLEQLASARALLGSGHIEDGQLRAREVLDVSRELDWGPLEAEALFLLGRHGVEPDAGLQILHQAASVALGGGHPRLAVRSWSWLARRLIRARDMDLDEAERWLAYADALDESRTDTHGEDLPLAAELLGTHMQLHLARGDYPRAELHARERLTLLRDFYGDRDLRVADALDQLGVALSMQQREDEAIDAYREALAILDEVHGPGHPRVATQHATLALLSIKQRAFAEALDHARRALEIRRRVYPHNHELVLRSLTELADAHLLSGDGSAGLAPALEVVLRVGELVDTELARARAHDATQTELAVIRGSLVPELLRLGRLLAGAGQHRSAHAVFGRALSLLDDTPGARLPPAFEPPARGVVWPPNLDGCRAEVLLGIEDTSRALGREHHADQTHALWVAIPVEQPPSPRRCLDDYRRWSSSRER